MKLAIENAKRACRWNWIPTYNVSSVFLQIRTSVVYEKHYNIFHLSQILAESLMTRAVPEQGRSEEPRREPPRGQLSKPPRAFLRPRLRTSTRTRRRFATFWPRSVPDARGNMYFGLASRAPRFMPNRRRTCRAIKRIIIKLKVKRVQYRNVFSRKIRAT